MVGLYGIHPTMVLFLKSTSILLQVSMSRFDSYQKRRRTRLETSPDRLEFGGTFSIARAQAGAKQKI